MHRVKKKIRLDINRFSQSFSSSLLYLSLLNIQYLKKARVLKYEVNPYGHTQKFSCHM